MKPFLLLVVLGVVGAIAASLVGRVNDCRDPKIVVLEGIVLDKTEAVRLKTVTEPQPGCSTCPGAGGVQTVQETVYRATVEATENGERHRWRVEVSAEVYAALATGATVKVRVFRGARSGKECRAPEIVLAP